MMMHTICNTVESLRVCFVVKCSPTAGWMSFNVSIYGNRSKSHIGSYEIIDFKDFNTQKPAKDCEHANETYPEGRPFHCL